MKKYILILSLLVLCVWSVSAVLTTKADTVDEEVSYQEIGTETPKLLPNNPFHFLKEWNWNIKRAFTFNPEKRAELELKISNEQVAEIKRLQEVDPNNVKAIGKAANNYQDNVERLKNRLEAIKETSENPNVDNLLNKLTDNSLKHQRIFDNLKTKLEENPELKEKIENIQSQIDNVIVKIPEKFENFEKFKERIRAVIEKQPQRVFKELQTVELLDRLEEKLPEDEREHLQNLKEEMISKFEDKVNNWKETDKENLLASQEQILKLIGEAKNLIAKVENLLSENVGDEIAKSVKELLERAKTHLANANKALDENKVGEAFGQVNSAISTAKNALRKIQQPNENETGIVCPAIAISCAEGENAVKTGVDNRGCPAYKCVVKFCGGIAGIKCPDDYVCKLGANYPDAGGKCVKKEEPERPICIQVIAPAISPEGVCKNFPTPCDVPANWKKTDKCKEIIETPTNQ
ncbi:MAG: DUF5667 domain-containing protein [Patescibacteria group bacterium]